MSPPAPFRERKNLFGFFRGSSCLEARVRAVRQCKQHDITAIIDLGGPENPWCLSQQGGRGDHCSTQNRRRIETDELFCGCCWHTPTAKGPDRPVNEVDRRKGTFILVSSTDEKIATSLPNDPLDASMPSRCVFCRLTKRKYSPAPGCAAVSALTTARDGQGRGTGKKK